MNEREQQHNNGSDQVPQPGATNVLIVATEPISGERTSAAVRERLSSAERVWVVFPATPESRLDRAMGDVDHAMVEAAQNLADSVAELHPEGVELRQSVGDSDPMLAIQDTLLQFPADEIVLLTRSDAEARAGETEIFEHAKHRFEPPIVHISFGSAGGDQRVTDVEAAPRGKEPSDQVEFDPTSDNMARFSVRDILGIIIAAVGSLVLIVLAANCDGGESIQRTGPSGGEGSNGNCVASYIIAGITVLANIANVVGMLFFESIGYRGRAQQYFSAVSLIGTPVAIIAVLLLG